MGLVGESTLAAAGRVVELVEPAREEKERVPESKREALQQLDLLLGRCRWLAAFDCMTEHGWACAQRTANDLLDFIFEGHADPRLAV